MKAKTGDPVGHYESNCHQVRTMADGNITLLREANRSDSLCPGEYFMRMNPSKNIAHDGTPDTCVGMVVISKHFNSVWIPGHKVYMVVVQDADKCFVMK